VRLAPARIAARAGAAGLLTLAVAACGSSTSSPAQVRSQASAICARANARIGRITTPTNATGALAFLDNGIASIKPELTQLQRLSVSGDAANVWNTAVRTLSQQLAVLETTASKIRGGADPVQAFRSLQQTLSPLETQADGAWQALQIPACQSQ
jgi:hypothetical protein